MKRRRLRPLRVLRAIRLSPWPTAWGLAALALFLAGQFLDRHPLPLGMLLAIPLLLGTAGMGWRAGIAMLPVGLGLLGLGQRLRGEFGGWELYLVSLAVIAVAVAAGHSLFAQWRRSEQRAHRNARRALLLSEATTDLQGINERSALFRALPRLLGGILGFAQVGVFVPADDGLELTAAYRSDNPHGLRVRLDTATGLALQDKQVRYLGDTDRPSRLAAGPAAPRTRSEIALPLLVDDKVVAVLSIEHPHPNGFGSPDRSTLRSLGRIAEAALARIANTEELHRRHAEQQQIADLTRRLTRAESTHQAGAWALEALRETLDLEMGTVLTMEQDRFRPLVLSGDVPAALRDLLDAGLERNHAEIGRSWESKRELFVEDYQLYPDAAPSYRRLGLRATAYAPILNPQGEALALVQLLSTRRAHPFTEHDRRLIRIVSDTLGVVFQRAALNRQLSELLEVVRTLAQMGEPEQLYARAVEAAVRLISGADTASILVRQGDSFHFAASVGFATEALRELPAFSEAGLLTWYGGDREAFRDGVPRLLTGQIIAARSSASSDTDMGAAARLEELKANICVPITTDHEVIGILNVDSLSAEDAFPAQALELAETFGQQIAVIIRQAQNRRALERSAITDPLTGLGNREGFNRRLRSELARAKRYDHPFHLLMIDLNRFKEINDTLGHQVGDRALVEVSSEMQKQLRDGDSLFRWGGDEFALILPHISVDAARRTAGRYIEAVERMRIGQLNLGLSIGIASYPQNGEDSESLLRVADDLMYRHKGDQTPPEEGVADGPFDGAETGVVS